MSNDNMKTINDITIFVINLECRKDRWKQVQQMFSEKGITNYERIDAIKTKKGYYGCVLSHIKSLTEAKQRGLSEVLIMEDDFHFVGNGEFIYPQKCDVCLYSCKLNEKKDYDDNFYRVNDGRHTDFYLVKSHYYNKLISVFMTSLLNLLKEYKHKNYLDVYWLKNQKTDLFLCPKVRLGYQREGYSDIINKEVDRTTDLFHRA